VIEDNLIRASGMTAQPCHPLGTKARILLTSVFVPYAQDDDYGSRKINPMELYQNQVTRVQGGFSLRMFHRSFGLMMIQANLEAPSVHSSIFQIWNDSSRKYGIMLMT
jgi:hypothetical protein